METEASNTKIKPIQVFKASEDGQRILSLAFHKNFLIVGTNQTVNGYTWFKNRISKLAWQIHVPSNSEQSDINSMYLNKDENLLFVGCGDNNIYSISLEDGKVIRSFAGHADYVHCVAGYGDNSLYSASEDGTVKFWDRRQKRSLNQLEPHTDERLARPQFGKWQGTVSVTEDWLVCGGGPHAAMWHLRSMECTTVFPFVGSVHVSGFLDDIVYVAGNHDHLCQYNLKGETMVELPVSASSVYSVISRIEPQKFMTIGGSSNRLDICTDFNYKDVVLELYQSQKK